MGNVAETNQCLALKGAALRQHAEEKIVRGPKKRLSPTMANLRISLNINVL